MANKSYEVEIRGNTKVYRAEFGKAISSNDKFGKSLTGLSKGATAVQGPMGGVASRISVLNSLFTSGNLVITGFAAGMAVLSAGTYKSLKVFDEYQRGQLKTEALLKATGNAAGFTAQQLENQASSVALNTLASVGGIVEAQNVLQTFKTVSGDTFTQAIELSQDMAATMGGTAKDKALQLGKALENPTEGLTALNKTGLTFTKSERDMVKAMQDAGDMADAQSFILRKLRDQVGGTGSAEAGAYLVMLIRCLSAGTNCLIHLRKLPVQRVLHQVGFKIYLVHLRDCAKQ
ncbi:phage tail length tape measure family protein [Paraglaciecola sp. Hal342]